MTSNTRVANHVAPSIDPFFFRVGPAESAECGPLRSRASGTAPNPATLPGQIADPALRRMAQIGCSR
jgi:hypothetical protein